MDKLNIELCPETGICSIVKTDGTKVDLMPDEVSDVRDAKGNIEALKEAISEADENFAAALTTEELAQLTSDLK